MHETARHIEATERSWALGAARIVKRTITWSTTAKADPQKPSEFKPLLPAIAGHEFRQHPHLGCGCAFIFGALPVAIATGAR
jgi:hypothetical protein